MSASIKRRIVRAARRAANRLGLDIVRRERSPHQTLLGVTRFPIRTVFDIGANEGQFARKARRLFPNARLICFEPMPEPLRRLREWHRGDEGIVAFEVALGERDGEVDMAFHEAHDPSSSILETTRLSERLYPQTRQQTTRRIRLRTLDDVASEHEALVEDDLLIKMDVQGYESRVIRGGRSTLRRARACLLEVCLDELYLEQATFREVFQLLDELGLSYSGNVNQSYGRDGHVVFLDALFVRRPETGF